MKVDQIRTGNDCVLNLILLTVNAFLSPCLVRVFLLSAPGPEAPSCQESGSVLQRLATQRQPDRQKPSGLPGD